VIVAGLDAVDPAPRVVALGSFDGVHLGHQRVIGRTVEAAGERGVRPAVVTFEPHPMRVLRPELAPRELSTPARRAGLIEQLGPDELVVIPFTHEFSLLDHERFAEEVLRDRLSAVLVIVGSNFRYGHRAQGTIETLAASGARLGFDVEPSPLVEVDGTPVSSSRVRDLLSAGEVAHAERLLGRHPWLDGVIVRGDGRGRELGFATANLECSPQTAFPATGVYAGRAHVAAGSHLAAISVGYNPTFTDDREHLRVEAHLLDFNADLYGQPMHLEFTRRLRGEERYGSVEELVEQVHRDIAAVRSGGQAEA